MTKNKIDFKPYEGWAVGSPFDPWIMGFTVLRTRSEAMKKYEKLSGERWDRAYRRGFRLIRVKVIQV